jgi:hypothetical protein
MTFNSDAELDQIRAFAVKCHLDFHPDPEACRLCMNKATPVKPTIGKSPSVEFSDIKESGDFPLRLESWNRTPSGMSLSQSMVVNRSSLGTLGNGDPKDAAAYAHKLRKFKDLREIRPLYILAETYGLVLSYAEFREPATRKRSLVRLWLQTQCRDFDGICKIMEAENDEVIDCITIHFEELQKCSETLLTVATRYVKRTNSTFFIEFIEKGTSFLRSIVCIEKVLGIWSACLKSVLDSIEAVGFLGYCQDIRVFQVLAEANWDDTKKCDKLNLYLENHELSDNFLNGFELGQIEVMKPSVGKGLTKEAIGDLLASSDVEKVIYGFGLLENLEGDFALETMMFGLRVIDGLKYSRLACVFGLLEKRNLRYDVECAALRTLFFAMNHSIDYHALMENPTKVLCEAVRTGNVWDLLPLTAIFDVTSDVLLVHLMVHVMSSSNFEDYRPFISRLTRAASLQPLLDSVAKRLSCIDRTWFYQSLGCTDLKKRQETINNLESYGAVEFIGSSFIENPSKLICELYSKISLHESLGKRLHKLAKTIAIRHGLKIDILRQHLLNLWLMEVEWKEIEEKPSIFRETFEEAIQKDERVNIQKCLFVLEGGDLREGCKWLLNFVHMDSVHSRAKAKAFTCLFVVADEQNQRLLSWVFPGSFETEQAGLLCLQI